VSVPLISCRKQTNKQKTKKTKNGNWEPLGRLYNGSSLKMAKFKEEEWGNPWLINC